MAENKNKKKLSKEELHEENLRLHAEVKARRQTSNEDSQRIVQTLSLRNICAYFLVVFLPPIGIPYIWKKHEQLYLRNSSLLLWTFVGGVCLFGYLKLIIEALGWI